MSLTLIRKSSGLRFEGKVCECVWYLCVRRGSKYFKVVYDWLTWLRTYMKPYLLANLVNLV